MNQNKWRAPTFKDIIFTSHTPHPLTFYTVLSIDLIYDVGKFPAMKVGEGDKIGLFGSGR